MMDKPLSQMTPAEYAEHTQAHYGDTRRRAEEDGEHAAIISSDDQMITFLRDHGWHDIAIGAFLLISSLDAAGDIPEWACVASLMVAATYSFGGSVYRQEVQS